MSTAYKRHRVRQRKVPTTTHQKAFHSRFQAGLPCVYRDGSGKLVARTNGRRAWDRDHSWYLLRRPGGGIVHRRFSNSDAELSLGLYASPTERPSESAIRKAAASSVFGRSIEDIRECERKYDVPGLVDACWIEQPFKTVRGMRFRCVRSGPDHRRYAIYQWARSIDGANGLRVNVPDWMTLTYWNGKDRWNARRIIDLPNQELRSAAVLAYGGWPKVLNELDASVLCDDEWGKVVSIRIGPEPPIQGAGWGRSGWRPEWPRATFVLVRNSTPEPDGTFREFALCVDNGLRPLVRVPRTEGYRNEIVKDEQGNTVFDIVARGPGQPINGKNAIASTFGVRGEQYNPVRMT